MKAIPLVLAKQKEISLFKLLGILSALVGGIVEEVFFRRWTMDMLMSRGVAPILQVIISGVAFGLAHYQLDTTCKGRLQVYASGNPLDVRSRDLFWLSSISWAGVTWDPVYLRT